MSSYLPRTLWFDTKDFVQQHVDQDQVLCLPDNLIILGEPGMGKTSLLRQLGAGDDAAECTARQLINHPNPRTLLGNKRLLVIDALDELAASGQGDAVDLVLRKLGELGLPRFILACRVADWRAATALKGIAELYGAPPLELHLDPLTPDEQRNLLIELTKSDARADELLTHFGGFGLDFLDNPQTLEMVSKLPTGTTLPKTSSALFAAATDVLRKEHRDDKAHDELPADVVLDAAGASFAAIILTGSHAITRKASANIADGELAFAEVDALTGNKLGGAIDTRLFRQSGEGLTYAHRRIGEYLAANWLAKRADTQAKQKRLMAMMRSEGRVPASLRGIHAWLALHPKLANDVIDADPMGVIEYGDADVLLPAQAKRLLDSIDRLSDENPSFLGWGPYRARALLTPSLLAEARSAIIDPARNLGLRKLLLEQLAASPPVVEGMRNELLVLLQDASLPYWLREIAGETLTKSGGTDWSLELEALRTMADPDSTQLAYELMAEIGGNGFSDVQIVETVLACDGLTFSSLPRVKRRRSVVRYRRISATLSANRLDGLLDCFAEYAIALLTKDADTSENDLLDLVYELVLRRIEVSAPEPVRLWRWIKPFRGHTYYRRDQREKLALWLQANHAVRQAMQQHILLPERDPQRFRARAFRLSDASPGLLIGNDDAVALLDAFDPNDRRDERWREILWLVRTSGEEGRPVREAAKRFATHRPDMLAWIDGLAEPKEPKWKAEQDAREKKRRAGTAVAHAENRKHFLTRIDAIRSGSYAVVCNLARAYLNEFSDIGEEEPAHERIAGWVGSDIGDAAHQGFEAFLQIAPPYPGAVRIAISHAKGTHWYAAHIVVAALAERLRTRVEPFNGVSSERLMAGLFQIWRTRIDDHAGFKELQPAIEAELKQRGDFRCAVQLYIEPQLRRRKTHVDQLYPLMRGDSYDRTMRLDLAKTWLKRFPALPADPQFELVDALLSAGENAALVQIVVQALANPPADERQQSWDAVQLIVDFNAARARLEGQGIVPELLWALRARGGERRRDQRPSASLSAAQVEWIVTAFRGLFPAQYHPSGSSSGDTNPWDASDYLRGLAAGLAKQVSDTAIEALQRLCDAPTDGYTDAFKLYSAEQRQARAEGQFNSPSLADLRAAVENWVPTTSTDLQAVLLVALDEVQDRLNGDPFDWYDNFFQDDGRHRDEELCRDKLLQMLDGKIAGVALRPEDHVADDKRVDIVAQITPEIIVPIEVKGQWNPHLWTAADRQLDHLYVNDWRADCGIYLVFWFGPDRIAAPPTGTVKPTTSAALKSTIEATSKAAAHGRVAVVVLDLTRPQPL